MSASVPSVTTGIGQGNPSCPETVSSVVAATATVATPTANFGLVSAHTRLADCSTATTSVIGTTVPYSEVVTAAFTTSVASISSHTSSGSQLCDSRRTPTRCSTYSR